MWPSPLLLNVWCWWYLTKNKEFYLSEIAVTFFLSLDASWMVLERPSKYHNALLKVLNSLWPSSCEVFPRKRLFSCMSITKSLCKETFLLLPLRVSRGQDCLIKTSFIDLWGATFSTYWDCFTFISKDITLTFITSLARDNFSVISIDASSFKSDDDETLTLIDSISI